MAQYIKKHIGYCRSVDHITLGSIKTGKYLFRWIERLVCNRQDHPVFDLSLFLGDHLITVASIVLGMNKQNAKKPFQKSN